MDLDLELRAWRDSCGTAEVDYGSGELLRRNLGYAQAFGEALASRPNVQQIGYAYGLRVATQGWSSALRRAFFGWFATTAAWQGGNSFRGFLENMRQEALAGVPTFERASMEELSTRSVVPTQEYVLPKGPGRDYSTADVVAIAADGMQGWILRMGGRCIIRRPCMSPV